MANYTDSIAVAILNDRNILQGVGNKLKHFQLSEDTEQFNTRIYDFDFRDKIHGIETQCTTNTWKILVYGGRYLAAAELDIPGDNPQIKLIARCKLNDVISSARINPNDPGVFDILTTYNVLVRMKLNTENQLVIAQKCVCEERSTLYCSHIRYADDFGDWERMKIFGGTALGEVLIWSPNDSGKSPISYRFSNPKGVLFSITTNQDCSQLFTTSDDRSVRFWNLKWNEKGIVEQHHLQLSCFGHMGRVFRSVLTEYDRKPFLISVGEDSRVCCWDMDGNLVFRKDIQTGASLWNVSVAGSLIYATASNGGLEVIDFREALRKCELQCIGGDLLLGDHPAKIRCLSADEIVCVTNLNYLKMFRSVDGSWICCCSIELGFKSTVLEVHQDLVILGGFEEVALFKWNGQSFTLKAKSIKGVIKSLVRAIHWITEENGEDSLLVMNDQGDGYLFNESMKLQGKISLRDIPGKERWCTSVLSLNNHLLIGDRHGNLHCFARSSGVCDDLLPLRGTLRKVHGNLGITGMYQISPHGDCFLTTGHDGMMRTIHLNSSLGEMTIYRTQRVPIKWIERVEGDLVMGFNDNHFTIWNRKDRKIVIELDCGGGHRYWDFVRGANGEDGKFIFIKNRQMHLSQIHIDSNRMILPDSVSYWHTMSTNCLRVWNVKEGVKVIISGGEEGLVKIHELREDGKLKFIDELTSHIANIRCMDIVQEATGASCLLFTAGGRAQMCVHRLVWTASGLEVRELCNFMLKSSDLDRGRKGTGQSVDFDPETRFMGLSVDIENSVIYTGCSDGYIRVFNFTEGLIFLKSELFYGKCVLKVSQLSISNGPKILLTMATDGRINFWRTEDSLEKLEFVLDHHESGINAFDWGVVEGTDNEFFLVSGGDDQGISGSRIRIEGEGNMSVTSSFRHPYRHTAQVSGIQVLRKSFLSVSVDQEVYEHSLDDPNHFKSISYTSVSDAKGISMIDDRQFLIYGAGVEMINCKK